MNRSIISLPLRNETEARVYLRSQVASGQMSEVEAQLRLAEIHSRAKQGPEKRGTRKKEPQGRRKCLSLSMKRLNEVK